MDELRILNIKEIVAKLVGATSFTGDHGTDVNRIDNICEAGELALYYVQELRGLAELKDDYRDSAKQMGKKAQAYIDEIKEYM